MLLVYVAFPVYIMLTCYFLTAYLQILYKVPENMYYWTAENASNSILAGAPPHNPMGELTVLPRPLAGFKGPTSKAR